MHQHFHKHFFSAARQAVHHGRKAGCVGGNGVGAILCVGLGFSEPHGADRRQGKDGGGDGVVGRGLLAFVEKALGQYPSVSNSYGR